MVTHELKQIFEAYTKSQPLGKKAVLATVVALEGSSYRRPGVRMLLLEGGKMIGAVSGGCVEKEVFRQAQTVFETEVPKVMTYDGRFRLGCEGVLYIALEPFKPNVQTITAFWNLMQQRKPFALRTTYQKEYGNHPAIGTVLETGSEKHFFRDHFTPSTDLLHFKQQMPACFKLVIIGAEHDAVQLCSMAALMGWEVSIVADPKEEKQKADFPGASQMISAEAAQLQIATDAQTAIVLMTHSYVKDLQFLMALKDHNPAYIGVLGPARRREKLFNELLELAPETSLAFIEGIYGPAGLALGAETPQEIAVAILAEILSVINQKQPLSLRTKNGSIHG